MSPHDPQIGAIAAAKIYAANGWIPLPICAPGEARRSKNGMTSASGKEPACRWHGLCEPEEGLAQISNSTRNVGVILGDRSGGLVDVDIDCSEALDIAAWYLPETDAVFGRKSTPKAHQLYLSPGLTTRQFKDPLTGEMIIELRANGAKKDGVFQTVFPPSVHCSGETIEWYFSDQQFGSTERAENGYHGKVRKVNGDSLERAVSCLASAALVARHWRSGSRHQTSLYLAGALAHGGWSQEDAVSFIDAVCAAAGDEEQDDRIATVNSTYERYERKEEVGGFGKLLEENLLDAPIVTRLREWLSLADGHIPKGRDGLTPVVFSRADIAGSVELISKTVHASGAPVYERSGPVRLEDFSNVEIEHGVKRQGGLVIRALTSGYLNVVITKHHVWQRQLANGKLSDQPPPSNAVAAFIDATSLERKLRPLVSLVSTPTLRPGTFEPITARGYDKASGIYVAWSGGSLIFPSNVTSGELDEAVRLYRDLLREVAFEDAELGLSVWLATLLSVLLKPCIGVSPMMMVDAPVPGTGKSFLAELIGLIALARVPPAMTAGWNDDELDKRLGAVARLGDQILLIDNIERELKSDTLCTMISSGQVRIRILGESETLDIPASAVVIVTGNNALMYNDLTRRTLSIRLNAVLERPETRTFELDPKSLVMADRAKYITAALNIFRGYVQDRKTSNLDPLVGFEEGYALIRAALVNAGLPDPAQAVALSREMDAGHIDDGALFQALRDLFPDEIPFTARRISQEITYEDHMGAKQEAREIVAGVFAEKSSISIGKILGDQLIGLSMASSSAARSNATLPGFFESFRGRLARRSCC